MQKMRTKGLYFQCLLPSSPILTGCEPLLVLDPKGPQAERQAVTF